MLCPLLSSKPVIVCCPDFDIRRDTASAVFESKLQSVDIDAAPNSAETMTNPAPTRFRLGVHIYGELWDSFCQSMSGFLVTSRGRVRQSIQRSKQPVQGKSAARHLNLQGDGQGDLAGYRGEHRTVMVYQMDAYRH
jgi:hypothetical protein